MNHNEFEEIYTPFTKSDFYNPDYVRNQQKSSSAVIKRAFGNIKAGLSDHELIEVLMAVYQAGQRSGAVGARYSNADGN